MKHLKASAALVCTLLMGWSQIIWPYSAYALSVQAAAASQSVLQTSIEHESQGVSSQGAQDDASGSRGVTEWYGDDAKLLVLMGKQIRIPANSLELASKNLVLTSQTVKPQPMIPLR